MPPIQVKYIFHPVGQGLFSCGELFAENNATPCFRWVYDCGSSSDKNLTEQAINNLASEAALPGSKPRLDLVTMSHFDEDHINGMVALLSQFSVETLLLPYIPLWRRMYVAFAEGINFDEEVVAFFRDPVASIAAVANVNIQRIIFVPSSAGTVPPDDRNDRGPAKLRGDMPPELEIDDSGEPDEEARADDADRGELEASGTAAGIQVMFLKPGSRLHLANAWEFVPYNDAQWMPQATKIDRFRDSVNDKISEFKRVPNDTLLKDLKGLYDTEFGIKSERRNRISLFLYTGPIGHHAQVAWHWDSSRGCACPGCPPTSTDSKKQSLLYTGDAYLNTQKKVASLVEYLDQSRVDRVYCLQVMHHGAKANWKQGVAKIIAPTVSVFSSDPLRKRPGHPHASVYADFLTFQPVQVDKALGAIFHGPSR